MWLICSSFNVLWVFFLELLYIDEITSDLFWHGDLKMHNRPPLSISQENNNYGPPLLSIYKTTKCFSMNLLYTPHAIGSAAFVSENPTGALDLLYCSSHWHILTSGNLGERGETQTTRISRKVIEKVSAVEKRPRFPTKPCCHVNIFLGYHSNCIVPNKVSHACIN